MAADRTIEQSIENVKKGLDLLDVDPGETDESLRAAFDQGAVALAQKVGLQGVTAFDPSLPGKILEAYNGLDGTVKLAVITTLLTIGTDIDTLVYDFEKVNTHLAGQVAPGAQPASSPPASSPPPAAAPPASPRPAAAQPAATRDLPAVTEFPADTVERLRVWISERTGGRAPGVPLFGSTVDNSPETLSEVLATSARGLLEILQQQRLITAGQDLSEEQVRALATGNDLVQRIIRAQGAESAEQLLDDITTLDSYMNGTDSAMLRLKAALAQYSSEAPGALDAVPDQAFFASYHEFIIEMQKMTGAEISGGYSTELGKEAIDRAQDIFQNAQMVAGGPWENHELAHGADSDFMRQYKERLGQALQDQDNWGWLEWLNPDVNIPEKLEGKAELYRQFVRDLPQIVHDIEVLQAQGVLTQPPVVRQPSQPQPSQTQPGQPQPSQPQQRQPQQGQPQPGQPQPAPVAPAAAGTGSFVPSNLEEADTAFIESMLHDLYEATDADGAKLIPDMPEPGAIDGTFDNASQAALYHALAMIKLDLSSKGVYNAKIAEDGTPVFDGTYEAGVNGEQGSTEKFLRMAISRLPEEEREAYRSRLGGDAGMDAIFDSLDRLHEGGHIDNELAATFTVDPQALMMRRIGKKIRDFLPSSILEAIINFFTQPGFGQILGGLLKMIGFDVFAMLGIEDTATNERQRFIDGYKKALEDSGNDPAKLREELTEKVDGIAVKIFTNKDERDMLKRHIDAALVEAGKHPNDPDAAAAAFADYMVSQARTIRADADGIRNNNNQIRRNAGYPPAPAPVPGVIIDLKKIYDDALPAANGDEVMLKNLIAEEIEQNLAQNNITLTDDQKARLGELTAGAVEAAQAAPAADRAGTFEERMRNGLLEAGIVYAAVPGAAAQPAPAVQPAPAAGATQAPAAASTQQGGGAAQEIRELRSVYADSINKQHDFYTHHKISDEQFTALLAQSQGQPDIRGYYIAMLNAGNPGFRPGTTLLHYLGDGQILATRGAWVESKNEFQFEHALIDVNMTSHRVAFNTAFEGTRFWAFNHKNGAWHIEEVQQSFDRGARYQSDPRLRGGDAHAAIRGAMRYDAPGEMLEGIDRAARMDNHLDKYNRHSRWTSVMRPLLQESFGDALDPRDRDAAINDLLNSGFGRDLVGRGADALTRAGGGLTPDDKYSLRSGFAQAHDTPHGRRAIGFDINAGDVTGWYPNRSQMFDRVLYRGKDLGNDIIDDLAGDNNPFRQAAGEAGSVMFNRLLGSVFGINPY